jgi:hypothetical protein
MKDNNFSGTTRTEYVLERGEINDKNSLLAKIFYGLMFI